MSFRSPADRRERTSHGSALGAGFSLIEIVVVLAIFAALVGALVPLGHQVQTAADERETRRKLENIKRAMIGQGPGEPTFEARDFAFLGDIGRVPDSLPELVKKADLPTHSVNSNRRLGAGWRGPYLWPGFDGDTANLSRDEFGRPLQYRTSFGSGSDTVISGDTVVALLRSRGADGALETDDDLTVLVRKNETTADLTGFVEDTAGSAQDSVDVQVTFRRGGSLVDTTVATDTAPNKGRYEVAGLPFGRVRTAALASGSGSGGSGLQLSAGSPGTDGQGNRHVRLKIFNAETSSISIDDIALDYPKQTTSHTYYRVHLGDKTVVDTSSAGIDDNDTVTFPSQSIPPSGTVGGTVLASEFPVLDRRGKRVPDLTIIPGGAEVQEVLLRFEHFIDKDDGLASNANLNIDMGGKDFTVTFSDGSSFSFSTP